MKRCAVGKKCACGHLDILADMQIQLDEANKKITDLETSRNNIEKELAEMTVQSNNDIGAYPIVSSDGSLLGFSTTVQSIKSSSLGGAAAIPRIKPIMGRDGKTQIGQIIEYDPIPQADGDGCTCLKGGPGCDTWEEYPGQTWGEFAKNSECPIHGEDR